MKKTIVKCDIPGCHVTGEVGDKAWWMLNLHRASYKSDKGEEEDKSQWVIRDLCPACAAKFLNGLTSNAYTLVFRRREAALREEEPADELPRSEAPVADEVEGPDGSPGATV